MGLSLNPKVQWVTISNPNGIISQNPKVRSVAKGEYLTMRLQLSGGCASDAISEAEKGPSEQSRIGEKDRLDVRAG